MFFVGAHFAKGAVEPGGQKNRIVAKALVAARRPDGDGVHPLSQTIHTQGGIAVRTGSLAPKGSVVKVAGLDALRFEGRARVFDGEDLAMEAVLDGRIEAEAGSGLDAGGYRGRRSRGQAGS